MSQPYSVDDGSFCDCCYKLPVEKVKSSFHCISILNGLCIAFVGVMEIWAFGLNWTANDDVCKSTKCCLKWNTFSKIFLHLKHATFATTTRLPYESITYRQNRITTVSECGFVQIIKLSFKSIIGFYKKNNLSYTRSLYIYIYTNFTIRC